MFGKYGSPKMLREDRMDFDFVRFGWPNTAFIAALALTPLIALTLPSTQKGQIASLQLSTVAPSVSLDLID